MPHWLVQVSTAANFASFKIHCCHLKLKKFCCCRSANRDECALGALSSYLVWYNDMSGVSIINTMFQDLLWLHQHGKDNYDPLWRKLYLVWGDSPFTPVSYTTHNNDITQLFNEGN